MGNDGRPSSKIVFVWGIAEGVGGTESRMAEVIEEMKRRDITVTSIFLTAPRKTNLSTLLYAAGSEILFARNIRSFVSAIRHVRPNVIMTFGLAASLKARAVSPIIGSKSRILDARNGLGAHRGPGLWWLDRHTQRLVHSYVSNSDAAAAELLKRGIRSAKIRVILPALGGEWLAPVSVDRDPNRIVIVGNQVREKNHQFALEVATQLNAGLEIRIYTDDATILRQKWKLLRRPGHAEVSFVEGHRVSPEDMGGAALLLHTSVSEGTPRVILEALSQGTPVVATDVGDIRRMVGQMGKIVKVGALSDTVEAINQVLTWDSTAGSHPTHTIQEYCDMLFFST